MITILSIIILCHLKEICGLLSTFLRFRLRFDSTRAALSVDDRAAAVLAWYFPRRQLLAFSKNNSTPDHVTVLAAALVVRLHLRGRFRLNVKHLIFCTS